MRKRRKRNFQINKVILLNKKSHELHIEHKVALILEKTLGNLFLSLISIQVGHQHVLKQDINKRKKMSMCLQSNPQWRFQWLSSTWQKQTTQVKHAKGHARDSHKILYKVLSIFSVFHYITRIFLAC